MNILYIKLSNKNKIKKTAAFLWVSTDLFFTTKISPDVESHFLRGFLRHTDFAVYWLHAMC